MKYELLSSNSLTSLNAKVNEYLLKGWELYGSPAIGSTNGHSPVYIQAVIFIENKPIKKQI